MRILAAVALAAGVFTAAQAATDVDAWWSAAREKSGSYPLRTRQLDAEGKPQYVNALVLQTSPYLLQHAHNPIRWETWSDQALARARRERRLIFVSVGYSTCHWCHVMARESFDDPGIARLLNSNYISIKIDREEHPELDERFLRRMELLSDAPGWPMNLILTPEGNVIAGESYLTRNKLASLLGNYSRAWKSRPAQLLRLGASIEARSRPPRTGAGVDIAGEYELALEQVRAQYDSTNHGFRIAPKFPRAAYLNALLDSWRRTANAADRDKLLEVLRTMARSALQDPVDGGFFRYSVSADWQQPHFEKTLYDQALLAPLFAEAWTISGDGIFLEANQRTLAFVEREMSSASGLFATAIDAESDGSSGAYYLWRQSDLDASLTTDQSAKLRQQYRAAEQHPGTFLLLPAADSATSPRESEIPDKLRTLRKQRPRPFVDRKAITGQNAMMIEALAQSGRLLADPQSIERAGAAMKALLGQNLASGKLHRYSIGGKAYLDAGLDDYAHLLRALAVLYEIDENTGWLERASAVVDSLPGATVLAERMRDAVVDRELPAAGATLIGALNRLARQTGSARYDSLVEALMVPARDGVANQSHERVSLLRELLIARGPAPLRKAYLADGHLRAEITSLVRTSNDITFEITLQTSPGWHVNSHAPRHDYLLPTTITADPGLEIALRYPDAREFQLRGIDEPLSVYEGTSVIRGSVRSLAGASRIPLTLTLKAQACSDRACMPPESARLFR